MKHHTRLLRFALLFSAFPFLSFSQSRRAADSLIALSQKPGMNDTVLSALYGNISWELMNSDINLAMAYAKKEFAMALKINRNRYMALAEEHLGNMYNRTAVYDSALVHYNIGLKLRKEAKQYKKMGGLYTNMAIVYARQSKFKDALDLSFKALKMYEQENDTTSQAKLLNNIGIIYQDMEQFKISEKFFRRSLAFSSKGLDKGTTLLHMGEIKLEQVSIGDSVVDPVSLDSSLYYIRASEKIRAANKDAYGLVSVYNCLGRIYVLKRDYGKAIGFYKKALENNEALEDEYGMAYSYNSLGTTSLIKKDYDNATLYFGKAIDIFSKLRHLDNLKYAYGKMTAIAEAKNDYRAAFKYHQLYTLYNDSLYNDETAKQLAEMQTRYETEKKDLELAKNAAELRTREEQAFIKNGIIGAVCVILLLVIITGITFYRKKQLQQKSEMAAELSRQKELRSRSVIEAEEKERIRIATDLHDGVGQLLSAAKLNLSSLEHQLDIKTPAQSLAFKNVLELVDDSVKEVRVVSHNMMPNTLLKLGLASAVKEFITKIQGTPSLKVNLEIVGMDRRLEQEKETVLYRVIQELVSNIIKHARASELTLQMIRHEKELSVLIEDNGVGFDTARLNNFEGIGLKNILSRIDFINGSVHFDSAPGRGTTVVIDVPAA